MINYAILPVDLQNNKALATAILSEYLQSMNTEAFHDLGISFDTKWLEEHLANLHVYAPPNGCFLCAQVQQKVVGCVGITKIGDRLGEIQRFYVNPSYRRKKIGRSLLEKAIIQSYRMGYTKLRLYVAPFLKGARSLYHSVGFKEIERDKNWIKWIRMELCL